jgi:hypothetical protein
MSTKYVDLSEPVYAEIETAVFKTYNTACILWIEEIVNPRLSAEFEQYKEELKNPNVHRLFHGTSEENANSIITNGFNAKVNKRSAYGNGTYFSTRAEYSRHYSKERGDNLAFMIVCDVACGKVCQGRANTPITNGFDSCTDNIKRPDMYIVDKRAAALPKYLVAFYPKAK